MQLARPLAVLASAAVLVGIAGPATAATATLSDPVEDTTWLVVDQKSLKVTHTTTRVIAKVTFNDLTKTAEGQLRTYFDTNTTHAGADYVLISGVTPSQPHRLYRASGKEPTGAALACNRTVTVRTDYNYVVADLARSCLGSPAKVKVATRSERYGEGDNYFDWSGRSTVWTPWLAKG